MNGATANVEQPALFEPTPGRPESLRPTEGALGRSADKGRPEGKRRARAGMDLAAQRKAAWKRDVAEMVDALAKRMELITADDVREEAKRVGLREPHSHNAWGHVLPQSAKRGVLEWTGDRKPSKRPEAHGNENKVWRSLVFGRGGS